MLEASDEELQRLGLVVTDANGTGDTRLKVVGAGWFCYNMS